MIYRSSIETLLEGNACDNLTASVTSHLQRQLLVFVHACPSVKFPSSSSHRAHLGQPHWSSSGEVTPHESSGHGRRTHIIVPDSHLHCEQNGSSAFVKTSPSLQQTQHLFTPHQFVNLLQNPRSNVTGLDEVIN